MKGFLNRRKFIGSTALAGASLAITSNLTIAAPDDKPAILGGSKARKTAFPAWPICDDHDGAALTDVLQTKRWGRLNGSKVSSFEKQFAALTGAKHCLATSSGTTALITSLGALGIGPGDEVVLSPYTFIATYNAIVTHYALPVFADTDVETFQVAPDTIARAINSSTKAILPVHIGGSPADLDSIMRIATKHRLPVVEDGCQAVMAEWRGRKVGTVGLGGCYSFQSSKNLTTGEGGAILSNDDEFAARCFEFHNHNHTTSSGSGAELSRSANFRMSEFHGNLLLSQLTRLPAQAQTRDENAKYLADALQSIPGLKSVRMYDGATRSSHHLFMMRYDKRQFANLERKTFLAALAKDGIPAAAGYTALNKDPYVTRLAANPHYIRIYGHETMTKWLERNHCPVNEQVCEEAVWFTQTTLLGSRSDMDQIVDIIRRIQKHAGDIARL